MSLFTGLLAATLLISKSFALPGRHYLNSTSVHGTRPHTSYTTFTTTYSPLSTSTLQLDGATQTSWTTEYVTHYTSTTICVESTTTVDTTITPPAGTQEATQSASTVSLASSLTTIYQAPAWISPGQTLAPSIPHQQPDGQYGLGSLGAPWLPPFESKAPMPQGQPWGSRTANYTYSPNDVPNTGVTRCYNFTLSPMLIAPDGVEKQGLVINGQFPGPLITANWGDWIEVTVNNNLTEEGTSMHWHGLLQSSTPWFDGVPSVDQCPIAPGSSFTYRFQADLYGTSWYHSHYSAQYADGLFGPMVIYGPSENAQYDIDLGPVIVNDWFHKPYYSLVEQVMAPISAGLPPPASNNVLINGKMNYPCYSAMGKNCTPNAGVSKFQFESGKRYRIRLINAGAEAMQKFSIDGHSLTVIADDFIPLRPYTTNVVTLGVGQRSDIIVEATGKAGDAVWMRSEVGPAYPIGCSLPDGISPQGVAAVYYEGTDTNSVPTTTSSVTLDDLTRCANDPLESSVPFASSAPAFYPQKTQRLNITFQSNSTHNLFYVNNSTFRGDYNNPVLLDAKLGHTEYPSEYNVYNLANSTSVRFVVYNYAQIGAHPMHMHGHNMYVLAEGTGEFNGTIVNPSNPLRRDVQILPPALSVDKPSYIVVQIDADNPGVWPFHCHIAWHVSAGLYINMLEQPDMIKSDMQIPSIMAQTCRDWSAWTGNHIPDEIDSGL